MMKKKICMVGDFSVGKTSLTQKFVNNVFSEKYLTTIGVKIDTVDVNNVKLVVWDVAGRDSLSPINANYLVGAAGVILVADGTREETINNLPELWSLVEKKIGNVPCVVALNKADLPVWNVSEEQTMMLSTRSWYALETSAKEGQNVAELFEHLVTEIVNR